MDELLSWIVDNRVGILTLILFVPLVWAALMGRPVKTLILLASIAVSLFIDGVTLPAVLLMGAAILLATSSWLHKPIGMLIAVASAIVVAWGLV